MARKRLPNSNPPLTDTPANPPTSAVVSISVNVDQFVEEARKLRAELHGACLLLSATSSGVPYDAAKKHYQEKSLLFHSAMKSLSPAQRDLVILGWEKQHPHDCDSPKCEHLKQTVFELKHKAA